MRNGNKFNAPQHHWFIVRLESNGVYARFKIELVRFNFVAKIAPTALFLPGKVFCLSRANFVALVVASNCSTVMPKTGKHKFVCTVKRQFSIDKKRALHVHIA